jgi:urease subunit alpha
VYGPRLGDRIHLADSGLVLEVTADDLSGRTTEQAFVVGFGRPGRDGIGLRSVRTSASCDVVVSNVVLVDPVLGVRATSIGIREGRVVAIGRAGNPDTQDGVKVVVGSGTVVVPGEGLIATPGGVDSHVHLMSPRVCEAELASGVTTILGQEIGPFWGVGVGSAWVLHTGLPAFDAYPVNVGLLGRGSSSRRDPLLEGLEAGVCGFKVHEDTGAHPRTLDTALRVADEHDVQVALHTDGLNETSTVADTIAVLGGRTVHAYHVEGSGGGHAPDVLRLAAAPGVLASSTNPTLPYGRDALGEQLDMIAYAHGLHTDVLGDVGIARDRIRAGTMAGENVLHDLGVIPITSSDAQGMGRAGETWRRTFALAALHAAGWEERAGGTGPAAETRRSAGNDNPRILRYLAKLTINPALAHGLADEVGSLQPGRLADIVLWHPARFAVTPQLVLKAGLPAWGVVGDPNATVDSAQPLVLGPQFGGIGGAPAELSVLFTNAAAAHSGTVGVPTRRRLAPVRNCRSVRPEGMVRHGVRGAIDVTPMGEVRFDGRLLSLDPADRVPLARLYSL